MARRSWLPSADTYRIVTERCNLYNGPPRPYIHNQQHSATAKRTAGRATVRSTARRVKSPFISPPRPPRGSFSSLPFARACRPQHTRSLNHFPVAYHCRRAVGEAKEKKKKKNKRSQRYRATYVTRGAKRRKCDVQGCTYPAPRARTVRENNLITFGSVISSRKRYGPVEFPPRGCCGCSRC